MKSKFTKLALLFFILAMLVGCASVVESLDDVIDSRIDDASTSTILPTEESGPRTGGIVLPDLERIESSSADTTATDNSKEISNQYAVQEGQAYYRKDDVALYLHLYNTLPPNYITKNDAMDRGWDSREGNLWEVTDRMVIGGDRFGNREGLLPEKNGRQYYEADVDFEGGYRDAKRLVYSNDGLIFYTDDHYASFTQLY